MSVIIATAVESERAYQSEVIHSVEHPVRQDLTDERVKKHEEPHSFGGLKDNSEEVCAEKSGYQGQREHVSRSDLV